MANTYYTLLTLAGQASIANAIALNQTVSLTHMAVGDGNGVPTVPKEAQTELVNEVYRAPINQLMTDPDNPNYLIAEMIVPTNAGGWSVREVGLFDEEGYLVAIANFPETYKPKLEEGSGRDLVIRIILQVQSTDAITLKIDPTIILASQAWVKENFTRAILLPGGMTGQFLAKKSNANGDTEWKDIPEQVNADWEATEGPGEILNKPELSEVAITGDYKDLINTLRPDNRTIVSEENVISVSGHASDTTEYGAGTPDRFGHLKITDDPFTRLGVESGVAITPSGVIQAINNVMLGKAAGYVLSSTRWVCPVSGNYDFTLCGGGGGGGGGAGAGTYRGGYLCAGGGGGGGGGRAEVINFSAYIAKDTPVSIVVGGGGSGGYGAARNGADTTCYAGGNGTNGGDTTITIDGTAHTASGGGGGGGGNTTVSVGESLYSYGGIAGGTGASAGTVGRWGSGVTNALPGAGGNGGAFDASVTYHQYGNGGGGGGGGGNTSAGGLGTTLATSGGSGAAGNGGAGGSGAQGFVYVNLTDV